MKGNTSRFFTAAIFGLLVVPLSWSPVLAEDSLDEELSTVELLDEILLHLDDKAKPNSCVCKCGKESQVVTTTASCDSLNGKLCAIAEGKYEKHEYFSLCKKHRRTVPIGYKAGD
ncbi:MAG: hypothetical protein KDD66_03965 [Bdellovibrionales bacterium]|nr:hypothetical protein [Bdellovibrionales bacterium]